MRNPSAPFRHQKGVISFFFFFQAEDGIRDDLVTGVQTCALPIWLRRPSSSRTRRANAHGSLWTRSSTTEGGCRAMQGKGWRWIAAMLLAIAALAVAACGDDDDEQPAGGGGGTGSAEKFDPSTMLGQIQEKGEITIGVKYDVPPFGFQNPQSDSIEGFDVDLGKAVAEKLGVKPKFIEAISDNRIPFIQDDTLHLVGDELTTEPYGAGIKKGETEMVDFVNGVFDEMKQDGRWQEIYDEWVGQYVEQQQEPPTMTLEEAIEASG